MNIILSILISHTCFIGTFGTKTFLSFGLTFDAPVTTPKVAQFTVQLNTGTVAYVIPIPPAAGTYRLFNYLVPSGATVLCYTLDSIGEGETTEDVQSNCSVR